MRDDFANGLGPAKVVTDKAERCRMAGEELNVT